jgi:hypothetical protein
MPNPHAAAAATRFSIAAIQDARSSEHSRCRGVADDVIETDILILARRAPTAHATTIEIRAAVAVNFILRPAREDPRGVATALSGTASGPSSGLWLWPEHCR